METERKIAYLEAAKAKIIESGWCQFTQRDDDGRYCIVGALSMVLAGEVYCFTDHRDSAPLARTMNEALNLPTLGDWKDAAGFPLAAWNNAVGRTTSEIIEAFDTSIIYAKEHPDAD